MPEAYPVFGTKEVEEGFWTGHVLDRHETFVANTIEDIAEVFDDHELIRSLGCEPVINVPVVVGGKILGTINCLTRPAIIRPNASRISNNSNCPAPPAFC